MIGSLAERIAEAMTGSDRAWPAEEIAREFLRLTRSGPGTDALVRGVLARDDRFRETSPGLWSIQLKPRIPILRAPFWLSQVESGTDPAAWRLHLRLRDRSQPSPANATLAPDQPEDWWQVRRSLPEARIAAYQPALLQRSIGWMERNHALEEWESIDLLSWTKIALHQEGVALSDLAAASRMPDLARRWGLGPIRADAQGSLDILSCVVDALEQRYPTWTEEDLAKARQEILEPREVDFSKFAFDRNDLQTIPAQSGVYRFRDGEGNLLYVGKAVSLVARVGSYFRSLPRERTKREDLLDLLRRFEIETCPSELEALILESRAIRTEQPRWNVQIEVQRPDRFPPDWRWPLVFVPPSNDRDRASVLILHGPDRGLLLRIPRDLSGAGVSEAEWLEPLVSEPFRSTLASDGMSRGARTPGIVGEAAPAYLDEEDRAIPFAHLQLHPQEVWLSLRYYARQRDQIGSCEGWSDVEQLWRRLRHLIEATAASSAPALAQ